MTQTQIQTAAYWESQFSLTDSDLSKSTIIYSKRKSLRQWGVGRIGDQAP